MTIDHLAEARRLIDLATDRAQVHALIAIAERLGPQTVDAEECGDRIDGIAGIGRTHFCARLAGHPMPHRSPEGVEWFPAALEGQTVAERMAPKTWSSASSQPSETVPVLLHEHRDRVWRDKDRELWRWRDEVWQVYTREIGWVAAAEGHRASNYRRFGPFTAVEEA